MSYPQINAAVINGSGEGTLGPPGPSNFTGMASSTLPVTFGIPDTREIKGPASSLLATRISLPTVLIGIPPSSVSMSASSLAAVEFGSIACALSLQVGSAQSLQWTQFGPVTAITALPASSLDTVQFSGPLTPTHTLTHSGGMRPSLFGGASMAHRFYATSLRRTRLGVPVSSLSGTSMPTQSLASVHFGTPTLGGVSMWARTLHATRFERPSLDRGTTC